MSRRAAFTQAELERICRALKAVGETVVGVEKTDDGAVRVLTGTQGDSKPRLSELERWRQQKRGRSAA